MSSAQVAVLFAGAVVAAVAAAELAGGGAPPQGPRRLVHGPSRRALCKNPSGELGGTRMAEHCSTGSVPSVSGEEHLLLRRLCSSPGSREEGRPVGMARAAASAVLDQVSVGVDHLRIGLDPFGPGFDHSAGRLQANWACAMTQDWSEISTEE